MNLASQTTTLNNESRNLSLQKRAELACDLARHLEKSGNYITASEALVEFWSDRSTPPSVEDLNLPTQADILLRVGSLVGNIEGANQNFGSQDMAKDLITRSIDIFQNLGHSEKAAEGRVD